VIEAKGEEIGKINNGIKKGSEIKKKVREV